jgi:hypothetical protein
VNYEQDCQPRNLTNSTLLLPPAQAGNFTNTGGSVNRSALAAATARTRRPIRSSRSSQVIRRRLRVV